MTKILFNVIRLKKAERRKDMISKMEGVKEMLSMNQLEKIFDFRKLINGFMVNVETLLLFETENNELIEQGIRYDIFEDDKISFYVDYPVSIDLRIGIFSVLKNKQTFELLKPAFENLLIVFSETYSEEGETSEVWTTLKQMMETLKKINTVRR